MNPFNLLINYVIASSRASYYNVSGNQEVTNTGLLAGMISDNPLMSYLLIDNKAKIVGENLSSQSTAATPVIGTTVTSIDNAANTKAEDPKNNTAQGTQTQEGSINVVTADFVTAKIAANNEQFFASISKDLQNLRTDLNTINLESIESKIKVLEENSAIVNTSIAEIKKKLEDFFNANPSGKDSLTAKPVETSAKVQSKTNLK